MAASTSSIRSSLLSSPKLSVPCLSGSVSSHCAVLSIRCRRLYLPFLDSLSISLQCAPNHSRISTSTASVMEGTPQKTDSGVSTIVDVDLGNQSYPIYIDFGLLDEHDLLQRHVHGKRVLVVTNTTIAPLYLDKVIKALTHGNSNISVESVILPDREAYKDMETLMKVFDKAIESRMDRCCTFVALDGGVIGDMCGFATAAFLRSVNFIQISTTLMAHVLRDIVFKSK